MENSPPPFENSPPQTTEFAKLDEKSLSISVKTFFFFFGDHLILGGKNLWISDFGRKITLNFGEDLFFFVFWRPPDFGRKKPLNFRFRPENHSQFRWRPFFFCFLETTWFWAEKTFEFPISAGKSLSISVKTFFFLFFGDHLILGGKNAWISYFGRKITLNFGEDIRIFEVLCLKFLLSPPPKFSRSATAYSPRLRSVIQ